MDAKYRFLDHFSCKQIDQLVNTPPYLEFRFYTISRKCQVTFTCWLGKADVLRVSCVSSLGFLLGMLKINAAWSNVAAVAVMR